MPTGIAAGHAHDMLLTQFCAETMMPSTANDCGSRAGVHEEREAYGTADPGKGRPAAGRAGLALLLARRGRGAAPVRVRRCGSAGRGREEVRAPRDRRLSAAVRRLLPARRRGPQGL